MPTLSPPAPNEVAKDLLRIATNRRSMSEVASKHLLRAGMSMADSMFGGMAGPLGVVAGEVEDARAEFEQDYLPNCEYALINVSGAPGEGKTTLACYLMDHYFAPQGRPCYWIGIPQSVLPKGWKEISVSQLYDLGVKIKKAAKTGLDAKEVVADFLPMGAAVGCDDASLYLASGSSDHPENQAIRVLCDIRRHRSAIWINTFQNYLNVDAKFCQADALIFKQTNPAMSGGERPEIAAANKMAQAYFAGWNAWHQSRGLTRRELRNSRILQSFVVCPAVGMPFPWHSQRPPWYGIKVSQNVSHKDFVDAEFTALDEE